MYIRYFCRSHAEKVLASEQEAMTQWLRMMSLGEHARFTRDEEKMDRFFGSAIDVALLRLTRTKNYSFLVEHLRKPINQLFPLFEKQKDFESMRTTLDIVQSCVQYCIASHKVELNDFITEHLVRLEQAELAALNEAPIVWSQQSVLLKKPSLQ